MVTQVASNLEILVINWLTKRGIAFSFQVSIMGGHFSLGGAVVDFLLEPNLAWRTMGEYFHRGVTKSGADEIQREMLSGLGYIVVDLWGEDLLNRLDETLTKALQGIEMLTYK